MPDDAAQFVWKLARRHSWGSPIPSDQLIRLVAGTEDHDELRDVLEDEVLELPFVVRSTDGIYIPNGQDAHIAAADWLRDYTGLDDFKIKATLSRLPDDWPRDG
jgi:hypothetical protein